MASKQARRIASSKTDCISENLNQHLLLNHDFDKQERSAAYTGEHSEHQAKDLESNTTCRHGADGYGLAQRKQHPERREARKGKHTGNAAGVILEEACSDEALAKAAFFFPHTPLDACNVIPFHTRCQLLLQ